MALQLTDWLSGIRAMKGHSAVMGILNVTPDSFSDGGQYTHRDLMQKRIEEMLEAGVDMIDVGGESTRPGAEVVSLAEELDRVLPAIEQVRSLSDIPVSIDTYKTSVMQQAVATGADMVNDVNALQSAGAVDVVAELKVPVCLMHKKGRPKTMQQQVAYKDVYSEVSEFLLERAAVCCRAGIEKSQILLDPGFGFGKDLRHNLALFQSIPEFLESGYPLLIGVSRKRMIAELLGQSIKEDALKRVQGSVAAAILASLKGAQIVRVHDVKETVEALKVVHALN